MGAVELRKAAETLRERAEAATRPEAMHPWGDKSLPSLPPEQHPQEVAGYLGGSWADYYATVHPGVGLALAEWLVQEADFHAFENSPALALARLINGGAS